MAAHSCTHQLKGRVKVGGRLLHDSPRRRGQLLLLLLLLLLGALLLLGGVGGGQATVPRAHGRQAGSGALGGRAQEACVRDSQGRVLGESWTRVCI